MDWFTWFLIIGFPVVIIVLVIVEVSRRSKYAYVYDKFKKVHRYKAEVKGGKVIFRYNEASKAGVAFEDNEFMMKKQRFFQYLDIDGTLLPVDLRTYKDNKDKAALDLSTVQEKLYETEALRAVAEKIDDSWWEKNKFLVFGAFIIVISFIIFLVAMKFTTELQPVPQPQIELAQQCIDILQNVSSTNADQFQATLDQIVKTQGDVPR